MTFAVSSIVRPAPLAQRGRKRQPRTTTLVHCSAQGSGRKEAAATAVVAGLAGLLLAAPAFADQNGILVKYSDEATAVNTGKKSARDSSKPAPASATASKTAPPIKSARTKPAPKKVQSSSSAGGSGTGAAVTAGLVLAIGGGAAYASDSNKVKIALSKAAKAKDDADAAVAKVKELEAAAAKIDFSALDAAIEAARGAERGALERYQASQAATKSAEEARARAEKNKADALAGVDAAKKEASEMEALWAELEEAAKSVGGTVKIKAESQAGAGAGAGAAPAGGMTSEASFDDRVADRRAWIAAWKKKTGKK